jgi:phospholipid/cholesterol/gamma-HCH transport system substrate-binding protein
MLSKVTKLKLIVFVAITGIALALTALYYVRLPQQVGIGRYDVNVELANAGGLYPQAMVTYRGVEVGKVTRVDLGKNGSVLARLSIDNGTKLPAASAVEVRSASVIGEQYVNFLPPADPDPGDLLQAGTTIPASRTVLPTTTNTLLSSVDALLTSIPVDDLRATIQELGVAFDGAGEELGRFIEASSDFQKLATLNLPATLKLIDDAAPVLRTQEELDPEIRSFARSLGSFSGQLRASDAQLRGVLAAGAPFMDTVGSFADDLTTVAPGMLSELADTGEVLRVYRDGIEHILTVLPAVIPMLTASIPVDRRDGARSPANLWFKLGVDPPTCTPGFENAQKVRNPADLSPAVPPSNSWCKVGANDPRAPRGARNQPCPNGGTGATASLCGLNFDKSVVSRGSNPAAASDVSGQPGGQTPSPTTWQALLTGLVTS